MSGDLSTATGAGALHADTSGRVNVANGFSALISNTRGTSNTAIGAFALDSNTAVAGIYSTKPGRLASPHTIDDSAVTSSEISAGRSGHCSTAGNGAIPPGDLLVTSSRADYAMKGQTGGDLVGAVVGKALEPLAKGSGVIQVLVTLP